MGQRRLDQAMAPPATAKEEASSYPYQEHAWELRTIPTFDVGKEPRLNQVRGG
jgi:hypothetical protein